MTTNEKSATQSNRVSPDVWGLLTDGQSTPTVPQGRKVKRAIDERATELGLEAYRLAKIHLTRRVAYECEKGTPVYLDKAKAMQVIAEGDLCDALARPYYRKLEHVMGYASIAKRVSTKFFEELKAELPGVEDCMRNGEIWPKPGNAADTQGRA